MCRQTETETRQEGHMGERGRTRAKWRKEHEARARANEHARRRGGVGRHGTMGVDDWSVLRSTSTAEAGLGLGPLGDDHCTCDDGGLDVRLRSDGVGQSRSVLLCLFPP